MTTDTKKQDTKSIVSDDEIDRIEIRRDFIVFLKSFVTSTINTVQPVTNMFIADIEGKKRGIHELAIVSIGDTFEHARQLEEKDDMKNLFGQNLYEMSGLTNDVPMKLLFHNGYVDLDIISTHMRSLGEIPNDQFLIGDTLILLKKMVKFPDHFRLGVDSIFNAFFTTGNGEGSKHDALYDAYQLRRIIRFVLLWANADRKSDSPLPLSIAKKMIDYSRIVSPILVNGMSSFIDNKIDTKKNKFWRKISTETPKNIVLRAFIDCVMPTHVSTKVKPKKKDGKIVKTIHYETCVHSKKKNVKMNTIEELGGFTNFTFCTTCCIVTGTDTDKVHVDYKEYVNNNGLSPNAVYVILKKRTT
jgi:hypothetical protein